jgi:hypothetical protein
LNLPTIAIKTAEEAIMLKVRFFLNEPNGKP